MWTIYLSGVLFHAGLEVGRHEKSGYNWWKLLMGGLLWGLVWPFLLIKSLLTGRRG